MAKTIQNFYESFQNLDAESMVSYYHDDVTFYDPAFGHLKGEKAKNMWRMLIDSQKNKNFKVYADEIKEGDVSGSAHWEAKYVFSKTGRNVHNIIEARFVLKDGLIIEHIDYFNLHRWAMQALGWKGALFGWTNFFKAKLQKQTHHLLSNFERQQASNNS